MDSTEEFIGGSHLGQVPDWNLFGLIKWPRSRRYIIYGMKYVGGVVSSAAEVTDSNEHIFENNKTVLMFERLTLDLLGPDCSFAVLTFVAVHNLSFRGDHEQYQTTQGH